MHGKSARTEAAHARAARASEGHGRALLPCAVLLALVALLIVPTAAFADGGGGSHYFGGDGSANFRTVLYSSNYAEGVQYIVGADNKYDAAAYICGQTSAQVAAYDLVTRYKLSATANDFAALADRMERVWPGWNEETLGQNLASVFARVVDGTTLWEVMTNIFGGTLSMFQVYYWQNNVDCDIYAIDTTSNAVSLARDDLQEILNGGGSSGGGQQPETDGNTIKFNMVAMDSNLTGTDPSNGMYVDGLGWVTFDNMPNSNGSKPYLASFTFDVTLTQGEGVRSGYDYLAVMRNNGFQVFAFKQGGYSSELVEVTNDPKNRGTYDVLKITTTEPWYGNQNSSQSSKNTSYANGAVSVTANYTSNSIWGKENQAGTIYIPVQAYSQWDTLRVAAISSNFITNGTPPTGPGNWPDPPENPVVEPPTVPDPPQNPEPDPPSTPTAPTPPPLEPPTNVMIPTGTTAADYTPWLRAILEQLQTLTDELAIHCVHLQEEMQTSVNELQDTLIYRFNSLESQILDLFNGLEDYLHDLAEWLAEQLDFNVNVDPYDDKSVLYWLRKIYSRLGNLPKAPTTVIDPDPTEPFDFWAWLMNLIANTVGGIIGDLVGDVAGLLDLFKDKFPFSIPWDIAAVLTLLDGTRATPVFDVKLAAVPGWWQETTFRIDLTPFDSVASACRTMVNILWIMVLAMKTDWMLAIMGDATSFGERFARKVARTS